MWNNYYLTNVIQVFCDSIGDPGAGECPNPKISLTPDDINQIMRPEECVALGGNCCNWAGEGWNDGVGGIIRSHFEFNSNF